MSQKKIDYKNYLESVDWLIKKSLLVFSYLRRKTPIRCFICHSIKKIIVHHWNYENIGDENLSDLTFMCFDCHKKWHKQKGFKEKWEREGIEEIIEWALTSKDFDKKIKRETTKYHKDKILRLRIKNFKKSLKNKK